MKIAVIGAGGIAQKAYLPLLAVMPEVEITGLFMKHVKDGASRKVQPIFPIFLH